MQTDCHCFKSNFILMRYYFDLVFIFWDIRFYSYDRSVKLNAEMEAEEEAFSSKIFLFVCQPMRAKKIK